MPQICITRIEPPPKLKSDLQRRPVTTAPSTDSNSPNGIQMMENSSDIDEVFVQDEGENREEYSTSEYESSNDSPASLDSDEELRYIRHKQSRKRTYDANKDLKNFEFEAGIKFKDFEECKIALQDWAVENGYNIYWKKYEKLDARCDGDCPWMLYASKLSHEETIVIKTIRDEHTCSRKSYNRQANSDWFARWLLPVLKRNANYPAKEIMHDIQLKFGIDMNEDLCYKAKKKALKQLRGCYEEHYARLPSYIRHLQLNDIDGKFFLKTYLNENDQPVFERAYIGFSALRKGLLIGCRKLICFDACFLKTALGGAILAAISKDCNSRIWPVAWAVVEKESEDSWTWFFNHLFE